MSNTYYKYCQDCRQEQKGKVILIYLAQKPILNNCLHCGWPIEDTKEEEVPVPESTLDMIVELWDQYKEYLIKETIEISREEEDLDDALMALLDALEDQASK